MVRATPITTAYNALRAKQIALGRDFLSYEEARATLESTPGVVFDPGTTFTEVLKKLNHYNLITFDSQKVRALEKESKLEKTASAQSQPSCTRGATDEPMGSDSREEEESQVFRPYPAKSG